MTIEVWMIWAMLDSEPDAPWVVDAWDEYSIENNPSGWDDAVTKAKKENENIRITVSLIDYNAVVKTFQPAKVELTGVMKVEQ